MDNPPSAPCSEAFQETWNLLVSLTLNTCSEMTLFRLGTEVFIYLFISDSVHYKWYFFLQNIIIGSSDFHNYDSYTVVLKKQHLLVQSSHGTGTFAFKPTMAAQTLKPIMDRGKVSVHSPSR